MFRYVHFIYLVGYFKLRHIEVKTNKHYFLNVFTDTGIELNCLKNPCKNSEPITDLDECLKYNHCYVSSKKQCLTKAGQFKT